MQKSPEQQPISGRFPLHVAAQLGYSNYGVENDRTPQEARDLSRKFERAFGEAWERIPRRERGQLLDFWETYPSYYAGYMEVTPDDAKDILDGESPMPGGLRIPEVEAIPENLVRRKMPMSFPNIEMLNEWSHYDRENGVRLAQATWGTGMSGTEIRFWIPAVEAMPENAVCSLIIWQLAQVCVYIDQIEIEKTIGVLIDVQEIENRGASRVDLCWPNASLYPLNKWLETQEADEFIRGWYLMLSAENIETDGDE